MVDLEEAKKHFGREIISLGGWAVESREFGLSLCQEIERLRKLVEAQKELINMLDGKANMQDVSDTIDIPMMIKELRTKIAELEESL